ncbi:protein kinase domain-containing protein [Streptomyces sp. BR1]|uniref:protein kinase domain-containing protein n=1 Tax=Streptomyces sp. BR1 TaxID=1592323 RepID=UPI00402B896C
MKLWRGGRKRDEVPDGGFAGDGRVPQPGGRPSTSTLRLLPKADGTPRAEGPALDLSGSGATPLSPEDPRQIGAFPLAGVLGSGGMGRVYLGIAPGHYAAVKQVLPIVAEDPGFLRHFGQELDNLAKLPGGISARLLATDRTARPPWFATEYVPGITLAEAMELHGGPLPADSLWALLREMARCLEAVHALDMVHRDLKPSNVMLTTDGLNLIDFGIARAADQSKLTQTGMVIGTPGFMAPERASGAKQLTGASDVFSLGCLLGHAATGLAPFGEGSGLDLLYRIVHEEPDLDAVRNVDTELADLLLRCLAKDPSARPSATDLLELTSARVATQSGPWPPTVAARIARRTEFTASVPAPEAVLAATRPATVPALPASPEPVTVTPKEAATAREPRPRRTRIMVAVLPVVVVAGTVTAVTVLPNVYSPWGTDRPNTAASPPGSVPSMPMPPGKTTPPPSASASTSPSPGSSGAATPPPGGTGQPGGTNPGGQQPGAPASGGKPGGTGGTGGSDGGQQQPPGTSQRTSDPKPPADPPSSSTTFSPGTTARLQNAQTHQCVSGDGSVYPGYGSCSASYADTWTLRSTGSGTFQLVNRASGNCLSAPNVNDYTAQLSSCNGGYGGTGYVHWRVGTTASGGQTLENTETGHCLEIAAPPYGGTPGPMVTTCDSDQSQQLWRNGA